MNSYKLTLKKIESLAEASFHDALLAVILVTTMLFRIFSRSLDREKTWYAFNDRLCDKQPKKFSKGSFFQLFPMNFVVLILLICTMKMAALSQASGSIS